MLSCNGIAKKNKGKKSGNQKFMKFQQSQKLVKISVIFG